jgi:cytochrome b561
MNGYLQTAVSGWAGVILFGSGLAMPYLKRRTPGAKTPFLRRMWPHYRLGYLVFFVSFAHAWLAMRSGNMRVINSAGVRIATIALLIMLWQIAVGLMLRNPAQSSRRPLRRTHFWTMALVAGLIVVHIAVNRP